MTTQFAKLLEMQILTGTVAPRAASGRDLRRVGGHSIGGMCRRGADGTPLMEGDQPNTSQLILSWIVLRSCQTKPRG